MDSVPVKFFVDVDRERVCVWRGGSNERYGAAERRRQSAEWGAADGTRETRVVFAAAGAANHETTLVDWLPCQPRVPLPLGFRQVTAAKR